MSFPALASLFQRNTLSSASSALLSLCGGLALSLRPPRLVWPRSSRVISACALALLLPLVGAVHAPAADHVIIDGTGCQVTEEDAVGIVLHSDLYLRIDFPDSHWRLGLRNQGLKGLSLVDVSLQAGQFTSKQYLIKHAGMADIFVPYDDGTYRVYDMRGSYDNQQQMDPADLPAQLGSLVFLRHPADANYVRDFYPKVAVECREAGIAWLCKQPGNHIRRRVQEVVVWGVYNGANYNNIIEYTFREDGSIGFRYGATGYNLPGKTSVPHVHNGLWRVSTKLFGRTDNQVLEFEHVMSPNGTSAIDSEVPVTNETSLQWEPLKFSSVIVQSSTQTNSYGHLMGYEFLPGNRTGTGRFSQRPQDKELWTLADYYLSNDNPGENGSGSGINNWRYTWYSPDDYLLHYIGDDQVLGASGDGIAVWYIGSAHHDPSDLDNQKGNGNRTGVTLVHWSGFDMEPHNLFDYNPLGGPPRCGN
jgi:Cu2+-containing amine oxidase